MIRRLLLGFALILFAAAGARAAPNDPAGPVLLKPHATVDQDVVRVGDLFEGAGEAAATPIARAPAPGQQVEVGARWLAAVAQAYGLAWRPRSHLDRIVVQRASQVIDTRTIEETLRDGLAARGVTGDISLVLDNPALQMHLPTGVSPTLSIASLSYEPVGGRFNAYVVAPGNGAPATKTAVTGRAVAMTEIPVLRRRLEPGDIIRRNDLDWIGVRVDRMGRNAATDPRTLIGKSPRRPLRAGQVIRTGDLREPVLVPKNSLVTIRLETDRMVLTVQGRALEPGAMDKVIRVMNTKSNKVINAVVSASGTVRVVPTAVSAANQESPL